jgi:hypothetical protein
MKIDCNTAYFIASLIVIILILLTMVFFEGFEGFEGVKESVKEDEKQKQKANTFPARGG